MPSQVTMNDKQKVSAGITILDRDGQPFSALPEGATAEFLSDDPTVADFEEDATGLAGIVTSGRVGSTVIHGRVSLPDGQVFEDSLVVQVVNSEASSANFTVGTPVEE